MIDVTKFEGYIGAKWSEEKLYFVLRQARRHPEPWEDIEGDIPEDGDEHFICSAPELLAEVLRLRGEVGKLRALLLGVLENDEAAEGFNNANLGELRDEIRNAISWKVL